MILEMHLNVIYLLIRRGALDVLTNPLKITQHRNIGELQVGISTTFYKYHLRNAGEVFCRERLCSLIVPFFNNISSNYCRVVSYMFIFGSKETFLCRLIDIRYNDNPLCVHFSLPSSILLASS